MSSITNITYLIEIIAIGLVSLALVTIVVAIFFRQWSGKAEHKKILELRHDAQADKAKLDITVKEIIDIERQAHDNLAETKAQMQELVEQQQDVSKKNQDIETRVKQVALLEEEVKHTADVLSEQIDTIEQRWDEKLQHTVQTVEQLSTILEDNLKHIKNQNIVANNLTQSLTDQYDDLQLEKKQSAIHGSIEATLVASTRLTTKLENLQQKAETAFTQFHTKLENFEQEISEKQQTISKTHIVFHDIDAIAPSVEEQLFDAKQLDESVAQQSKTANESSSTKKRPQLDSQNAESLTESLSIQKHIYKDFFPSDKKKVNE